jgi:transposase
MPPASQHKNEWVETMNNLGIDVGKKKCRAALKDERGEIISEFLFTNNNEGISALVKTASYYGKCTAVLESTANMWIRIHDTLEENGIDTILANPYKTKIIAEAKIKSDKLDAKILADLLRTGLVYCITNESIVCTKQSLRGSKRYRLTGWSEQQNIC